MEPSTYPKNLEESLKMDEFVEPCVEVEHPSLVACKNGGVPVVKEMNPRKAEVVLKLSEYNNILLNEELRGRKDVSSNSVMIVAASGNLKEHMSAIVLGMNTRAIEHRIQLLDDQIQSDGRWSNHVMLLIATLYAMKNRNDNGPEKGPKKFEPLDDVGPTLAHTIQQSPAFAVTNLPVTLDYFASKTISSDDLVVVSPDVGGVARAYAFAKKPLSNAPLAIVDKTRHGQNVSEIMGLWDCRINVSPTSEKPNINKITNREKLPSDANHLLLVVLALFITLAFGAAFSPPEVFLLEAATPMLLLHVKDTILGPNRPPLVFYYLVLIAVTYTVSVGAMLVFLWRLPYTAILVLAAMTISIVFGIVVYSHTPHFLVPIGSIMVPSSCFVWIFVVAIVSSGLFGWLLSKTLTYLYLKKREKLKTIWHVRKLKM